MSEIAYLNDRNRLTGGIMRGVAITEANDSVFWSAKGWITTKGAPPMKTRRVVLPVVLLTLSIHLGAAENSVGPLDLVKGQGGLCVLLGAGSAENPDLIADLAINAGLLVHGLAIDDASYERAGKAIEKKGVAGHSTVERAPLNPLPYLNDLARFVIVDDFAALSSQGVTKEEILRITAPNGTVCTRASGAWSKTVKPMPATMDEWTHPLHGPDCNQVSSDSALKGPLGIRWQDGLPVVAHNETGNMSMRAGTASWVMAGGKVFAIGINELENLSERYQPGGFPEYITARDAFSGIPLWKLKLDSMDGGGAGNWYNSLPIVATDKRVYAGGKSGVVVADAESGKVVAEYKTSYTPSRIILLDNVLVVSTWEKKVVPGGIWSWAWLPKTGNAANAPAANGSVEAFEADSGKRLWDTRTTAFKVAASQGVVYLEVFGGEPSDISEIAALDLKTGKEQWRLSREKLGCAGRMGMCIAGPGFVTVSKEKENCVAVLDAKDGKERFTVPGKANWIPLVHGQLWLSGKKYDPASGAINGAMPIHGYFNGCQQVNLSENAGMCNWGIGSISGPKFGIGNGVRPSCVMSFVPAYGMAYTAANPCACRPGAAYGFTAIGCSGSSAGAADFEKPRPTEKGPAFGPIADAAGDKDSWPVFRHDSQRSTTTTATISDGLKLAWRTPVAKADDSLLSNAWRSRAISVISAPVVEGELLFVTANDTGQVLALDATTGKPGWTVTLGSRLEGPPTIYRGLCLIGCHDGWVYALRAKDGQLAWRTRIAPWERRMTAFGRVESVWPALGPVLVHDDVLYASAGRSSEIEGGIALAALEPATGKMIWGNCIAAGPERTNDVLSIRDNEFVCHYLKFDPKNGALLSPAKSDLNPHWGAMLDGSWTIVPGSRRAGNAYSEGDLFASELAWNETTIVSPKGGITREKANANGKRLPASDKSWQYTWQSGIAAPRSVFAIAMTANAVLYAGSSPEPKSANTPGFLRIVSPEKGELISEFPLECPPVCDGVAVAGGRVYVSLINGEVCCFGK
jgi:outer membrane protein assembly factor BamB